jgi:hypothetical protein
MRPRTLFARARKRDSGDMPDCFPALDALIRDAETAAADAATQPSSWLG